jgi:hypothetical protein
MFAQRFDALGLIVEPRRGLTSTREFSERSDATKAATGTEGLDQPIARETPWRGHQPLMHVDFA